jgi:pyruvate ferredoxin oxidoreductase beta subunit
VVDGVYKLSYKPQKFIPIEEFLKPQKRFKHLFKPENKHIITKMQEQVEKNWKEVLRLCGEEEYELKQ